RASRLLRLTKGGSVSIAGSEPIPVGAFADTGAPNLADVLVDGAVGHRLGLDSPDRLVVATPPGAQTVGIARLLRRKLPERRIRKMAPQEPRVAGAPAVPALTGYAQGGLIGTMHFIIHNNGTITPDPAWVQANIVTQSVPILGQTTCNRV